MDDFAGRVAVVTGAGSGIGKAIAIRLAAEGMRMVISDIQPDALAATADELRASGAESLAVRTDVSKPNQVQALADAAIGAFGKVHVLCQNAGVEGYLDGPLWAATDNDWAWTFGVNFWSVAYGIRAFVPHMIAHGEPGHVVNTASMTALIRAGNMYGITKHAVLATSEVLERQLRESGSLIGVTALCPGTIATNLFLGGRNRPPELTDDTAAAGAEQGRELRARMHAALSQGMPPSEVADQVVAAIRSRRLYALTDRDWDDRITSRHADILGGSSLTGDLR